MIPTRESEIVEFKKTTSELKEGVISLSSMLNKNGEGVLYIGIKNDGSVFGQEIGAQTLTRITNEIKNHVKPIIFPKIETVEVENKNVIKVSVVGSDTPYSAYGRYYKRVDDQDLEMPQNDLEEAFVNKNITYSKWENTLTGFDSSYVNEQLLIEYIDKANEVNRLNYRYVDVDDALTKLNLLENGYLNNAGYYLFGVNKPLLVKMAIFATDERLTFVDNKRFEGNIFECMQEFLKYITSNIHYHAKIVGFERIETPEIPLEAIREIVINSFVHMRVTPGEYNEIIITPSKIRVYNPGTIALNKSPKDFANGIIGSKIRNPLIGLTLYKNKSIEAFGTGFKRVFELCEKESVKYNFGNDGIGFYFEFYRNNVSNDTINDTLNDTLNSFEKEMLIFIKQNNGVLNCIEEAMVRFKKSRITIQRTMSSLIEKGRIIRIGSRKDGYWQIVK